MGRPANRLQLMDRLGAKQKNTVWSWCGVNEDEKSVYFSVWTDYRRKFGDKGRDYYTIQGPHWGMNKETGKFSAARKEHDENLEKVFSRGYQAFGYFVVAKDKNIVPREIAKTRTSFLFSLELERLEDDTVIGYPLQRIEIR
jgi:hypothetical protein